MVSKSYKLATNSDARRGDAREDGARREYWAQQLDKAHEFMMRVMKHPVVESGEEFVPLPPAADKARVEVIFSDKPHVKDLPRLYYLRQAQIDGFLSSAEEMNRRGWVLKVEDGFRNRTMQKHIGRTHEVFDAVLSKVLWELGGKTPNPAFLFKRLLTLTAQMPKIGTHMSGSAIDISVFEKATGREVPRGGKYIEISERTPMESPFISPAERRNRDEITSIMRRSGFIEYPFEFWHYNSGDAFEKIFRGSSEPARYGAVDFDVATMDFATIGNPEEPLNDLEEIEQEIEASLKRIQEKPS